MTKHDWFDASTSERADYLRALLKGIIDIDKLETVHCKRGTVCKSSPEKFNLEQRVLQVIAWEREENQED